MSNILKNLDPNEQVVLKGEIHPFIFTAPLSLIFISGCIFFFAPALVGIGAVTLTIGLVILVSRFLYYHCTDFILTSKRVASKTGFIAQSVTQLPHSRVESVHMEQSILGRLLGFGTITVQGTGGGVSPIKHIANPHHIQTTAQRLAHNAEHVGTAGTATTLVVGTH